MHLNSIIWVWIKTYSTQEFSVDMNISMIDYCNYFMKASEIPWKKNTVFSIMVYGCMFSPIKTKAGLWVLYTTMQAGYNFTEPPSCISYHPPTPPHPPQNKYSCLDPQLASVYFVKWAPVNIKAMQLEKVGVSHAVLHSVQELAAGADSMMEYAFMYN